MRSLRITIGLATAACTLAVSATPALATKEKPKVYFGHFTASIFGQTISPTNKALAKGKGEAGEPLKIGPIECATEYEGKSLPSPTLSLKAMVESERSSDFTAIVNVKGCYSVQPFGKGGTEEKVKVSFGKGLKMEFHANGSAALGNPSGEVKILETAAVPIKVQGRKCKLFIPAQTVPVQDERKEEREYEAAEYGFEKEELEEHFWKKYPSKFKERLEISWELKKIVSYVPVEPPKCGYKKGTEGKYEPEGEGRPNRVEFNNGEFSGDVEEIEIKGGELGFDPVAEP
jgi:hypothetical protein